MMLRKSRYFCLSDAQVRSIRWYHDQGWTRMGGQMDALGAMYGVKARTIQLIGYRQVRQDVPEKKKREEVAR